MNPAQLLAVIVAAIASAQPTPAPAASASASASPPAPVEATSALLASAAGACTLGAAFAQACADGSKATASTRFVHTYPSIKPAATGVPDLIAIPLPVDEYGKGFLFAPVEPAIDCGPTRCLFEPSVTLLVAADPAVVASVASARVTFRVDGMWRTKQWWGPRPTSVRVALLDAKGAVVGESDALVRQRP